jgi:hypothetical protein
MIVNEKTMTTMRIAELHAAADALRLARLAKEPGVPAPRRGFSRLIRIHRSPATV